jgi:methyltransferase
MVSRVLYTLLILLVIAERGVELWLSRRNARLAFARGAVEAPDDPYRAMVILHVLFLLACPAEVWLADRPFRPAVGLPMLAAVAAAMALRYWAVLTLGDRWNTRVICLAGVPAVTTGPYRWIRHPNYLAVVTELAALPMVHSAWVTAIIFSLLNMPILARRIRVEEEALSRLSDYEERLGDRRRFFPVKK